MGEMQAHMGIRIWWVLGVGGEVVVLTSESNNANECVWMNQ